MKELPSITLEVVRNGARYIISSSRFPAWGSAEKLSLAFRYYYESLLSYYENLLDDDPEHADVEFLSEFFAK